MFKECPGRSSPDAESGCTPHFSLDLIDDRGERLGYLHYGDARTHVLESYPPGRIAIDHTKVRYVGKYDSDARSEGSAELLRVASIYDGFMSSSG